MEHKVEEVKLKCGAKGLLIDVPDAPVVCMEIWFRAGDAYTPSVDKLETAHLMEHIAFAANKEQKNAAEVARVISKYGADYNAHTSKNFLSYEITCPDFDWERLLKHLVMQVTTPKFLKKEFDAEFGNVKEEMQLRSNNKWTELGDRMNQSFGFDYAQTNLERLELMSNVKYTDIKQHYLNTHFVNNCLFFIAGPIKENRNNIIEILEGLKELPSGPKLKLPEKIVPNAFSTNPVFIPKEDVPNVFASIEMFAFNGINEDELTANLVCLCNVMGNGDHSRVYGKARAKGIVYGLGFSRTSREDGLYSIDVSFQVSKDNMPKLLELLVKEMKDVAENGLTNQEVEEAIMAIKGSMRMSNQTAGRILNWNVGWYISSEEEQIHDYDKVASYYDKVTPESIQKLFLNLIKTKKWGAGFLGNVTEKDAKKWNAKLAEIFED